MSEYGTLPRRCEVAHCDEEAACFYEDRNGVNWLICRPHARERGYTDEQIDAVQEKP